MSNAAKFETPDGADNGKTYVYNSGTDAHVLTDMATQAELDAHTGDTSDAHDASAISFSATGTIASTDVQAAIAEVASDAASALTTHEADTTSVHGITDTSALLTTSSGIDALSDVTITAAASGDILRHNGTAWVDAVGTTHFEVAGAVATHSADTTAVHGITDTDALATIAKQDTKPAIDGTVDLWWETDAASFYVYDPGATDFVEVGGAMTAAAILAALLTVDGAGSGLDADTLDGNSSAAFATAAALAAHEADTTSIHGITDTSALVTTSTAPELIRDTMGTALVAGSNVTITVNDGADTITIAASGGGGSVTGGADHLALIYVGVS